MCEQGIQAISTGIYGPLPPDTVGLIIVRSGLTMKGLQVLHGVIDADYHGEIKVIARSDAIHTIQPGKRIAQLLLLPYLKIGKSCQKERGTSGFGSSGTSQVFWTQEVTTECPQMTTEVNEKNIRGLTDTGADVSVVYYSDWPPAWPLITPEMKLRGLGVLTTVHQSQQMLSWVGPEGKMGYFKPYVADIPITLWGRALLSAVRLKLTTADICCGDSNESSPGWKLTEKLGYQKQV